MIFNKFDKATFSFLKIDMRHGDPHKGPHMKYGNLDYYDSVNYHRNDCLYPLSVGEGARFNGFMKRRNIDSDVSTRTRKNQFTPN